MNEQLRFRVAVRRSVAVLAVILLGLVVAESGAQAYVPPAQNGKIAFSRGQAEGLGSAVSPFRIYSIASQGSNLLTLTDGGFTPENNDYYPAYSWDGLRIAFTRAPAPQISNIAVMNADGTGVKEVTVGPGFKSSAGFSVDGKTIYYASNADGDFEIMSTNLQTKAVKQLTNNGLRDSEPAVDPWGRIVFVRDNEIYRMNADGSGVVKLAASDGHDWQPSVARTGNRIVFTSTRDGNSELYSMRLDGSELKRLTFDPSGDVSPTVSPDGKKVAFCSNRWEDEDFWNFDVATMNIDGSGVARVTKKTTTDVEPSWQPLIQKKPYFPPGSLSG